MILTDPEPIDPSYFQTLLNSAAAWKGDWGWNDPDEFDPKIWGREEGKGVNHKAEAKVIYRDGPLEIAVVSNPPLYDLVANRDSFSPEELYQDHPSVDRHWHTFVAWSAENPELSELMDLPPVDGLMTIQTVLAEDDRLVPVAAEWRGKKLTEEEAMERFLRVLMIIESIKVQPEHPAPALSEEIVDMLRAVKNGENVNADLVVSKLLDLDRNSFAEALDRVLPWMAGNTDAATAAWMEKNDELANRMWLIRNENNLEGVMRLAPWKSGLGNPLVRDLYIPYQSRNTGRVEKLSLKRKSDGKFT